MFSDWWSPNLPDMRSVKGYFVSTRNLTPLDIDDFSDAAYQRENAPAPKARKAKAPKGSTTAFLAYMNKYNKVRVWRLKRDLEWWTKQAQKHGIDPDQARFLL